MIQGDLTTGMDLGMDWPDLGMDPASNLDMAYLLEVDCCNLDTEILDRESLGMESAQLLQSGMGMRLEMMPELRDTVMCVWLGKHQGSGTEHSGMKVELDHSEDTDTRYFEVVPDMEREDRMPGSGSFRHQDELGMEDLPFSLFAKISPEKNQIEVILKCCFDLNTVSRLKKQSML